jgi:hypothetical protein
LRDYDDFKAMLAKSGGVNGKGGGGSKGAVMPLS